MQKERRGVVGHPRNHTGVLVAEKLEFLSSGGSTVAHLPLIVLFLVGDVKRLLAYFHCCVVLQGLLGRHTHSDLMVP